MTQKKIEEFKEICKGVLDNPQQLELVASVDFVYSTWHPESGDDTIVDIFKKHKTQYFDKTRITDSEIKTAFNTSRKLRE